LIVDKNENLPESDIPDREDPVAALERLARSPVAQRRPTGTVSRRADDPRSDRGSDRGSGADDDLTDRPEDSADPDGPQPSVFQRNLTTLLLAALGLVIGAGIVVVLTRDDGGGSSQPEVTIDGRPLDLLQAGPSDPAVGRRAPVIEGETYDGDDITVGEGGTPQVLAFLSHWCQTCRSELPALVELGAAGTFEGVDVVAVSTAADPAQPNSPPDEWFEREAWTYPVLVDDGAESAAIAYGANVYPFFVFIDGEGRIAGRASGEVPPEALAIIIRSLADGTLTSAATPPPTTVEGG
jgi:thiol-disulfide isomerase/thioredoxin